MRSVLTDDNLRSRFQFVCVFALFAIVSFVMTVVNYFTGYELLMFMTFSFCIANVINIYLANVSAFAEKLSHVLFAIEIVVLFTGFLIFGEPEGFSAIWLVLLPACGLLLYQFKYGTIISAVQLVIAAFLLWTPPGKSLLQYKGYTASFMLRFPILYTASYFLGFFFEKIIDITRRELSAARDNYRVLYNHDALTGLYNRIGFNEILDEVINSPKPRAFAFIIADIDNFKDMNDELGHINGDVILKQVSEDILRDVGDAGKVCRWGGEEIAVILDNPEDTAEICEKILTTLRNHTFKFGDIQKTVTVSIGAVKVPKWLRLHPVKIFDIADKELYKAKNNGKNQFSICTAEI